MTARELSQLLNWMDLDTDVCIKVDGVTADLDGVDYGQDDEGETVILIHIRKED